MTSSHALLPLALCWALAAPAAQAGDGHDHGDTLPAAGGHALPRFAAVSETFELVGVLEGNRLTLYLDRSADNSPVTAAQIELDLAGAKFTAARHGEDEFEVVLPQAPGPGLLPVTATVRAGGQADLLAGELDIHDEEAPAGAAGHTHGWHEYAGWLAGGLGALALLVSAGRRRVASGGAA